MNHNNEQHSYVLETKRLRLRRFDLGDSDFIVDLLNSDGWLKYIGDRKVKTKEQAERYLEKGPLKSYEQNGYGLCMVETKQSVPIGMCGILRRLTLENPDIGFAFLQEFTRKGYGYEIAEATLNYAHKDLKFPIVSAITVPHNTKSIKLLEKLGMRLMRSILQDGEELLLFEKHIAP
jgi:RimJ/RimL family protein N-acetyltransferase